MTPKPLVPVVAACAFWLCAACAEAQNAAPPGRFELSAGLLWMGTSSVGSSDATLTGPSGDQFRLFTTSSEWTRAFGGEVRAGGRVTRLVQAEGSISYAMPRLRTSVRL